MELTRLCFLFSFIALLSGCASPSKSADALRENVKNSATYSSREVFEVRRPYRQVADTVKKKWLECLDTTTVTSMRSSTGTGTGTANKTNIYKPTATVTAQRTELTLQYRASGTGFTQIKSPSPHGFFIVVTDIYPADKNSARIDVQKHMPGYAGVIKAVRHWAEGTNLGCPDLAQ